MLQARNFIVLVYMTTVRQLLLVNGETFFNPLQIKTIISSFIINV